MADKTNSLKSKLMHIQTELKAPKNLYNSFGKYHYRNAEGIQEALKPFEKEYGVIVTLSDEIVEVGGRVYVKATATITDAEESISVTAYAREALDKKGMDDAQVTGATSSYARKYALNGLFLLDDTKDVDTEEYQSAGKQAPSRPAPKSEAPKKENNEPSKSHRDLFREFIAEKHPSNETIMSIISKTGVNNDSPEEKWFEALCLAKKMLEKKEAQE